MKTPKHVWTERAIMQSRNRPDTRYRIDENEVGALRCQCKGFVFNREDPKRCPHLDLYRAQIGASPVPLAKEIFVGMLTAAAVPAHRFDTFERSRMVAALAQRLEGLQPTAAPGAAAGPKTTRMITFDD
jgi:hypothetical protein